MNQLKEYLKRELGISDEQYESLVNDAKKTSPVNDLNNIANVEAIQMQMIDNLGQMVGSLMAKVTELEGKING